MNVTKKNEKKKRKQQQVIQSFNTDNVFLTTKKVFLNTELINKFTLY